MCICFAHRPTTPPGFRALFKCRYLYTDRVHKSQWPVSKINACLQHIFITLWRSHYCCWPVRVNGLHKTITPSPHAPSISICVLALPLVQLTLPDPYPKGSTYQRVEITHLLTHLADTRLTQPSLTEIRWHCHVIWPIHSCSSGTRNVHFFHVIKHDFETDVWGSIFRVFSLMSLNFSP